MSVRELLRSEDSFVCSWTANKDVRDSVKWGMTFSSGLEAVSVDTCVLLSRPDEPQDCQSEIRFILQRNFCLSQFTVVSDARIVEVYGACGGYVCTKIADFVDEFEGMVVYVAEVMLPEPLSECTIKFAGLKTNHQMWLYGIHLSLEESASTAPSKRLINFQNVNQMIERSGCKLSEKAEQCQNFLESFSANQLASDEVATLLKKLESCHSANGEGGQSLADWLGRFSSCPRLTNSGLVVPQAVKHASECKSISNQAYPETLNSALCSLRDYIDHRFAQSEKLLLEQIDEKFRELEARQSKKLDLIIKQLKILNNHT